MTMPQGDRQDTPPPSNVIPFRARPREDGHAVTGAALTLAATLITTKIRKPDLIRDRTAPISDVRLMVELLCQTIHTPHGRAVVEETGRLIAARLAAVPPPPPARRRARKGGAS